MALTSSATASISGNLTSSFDGVDIKAAFSGTMSDSLTSGTGINQADLAWWDTARSLASTSEELDLAGGLTDPFGNTITFARVKGLYIKNTQTTAGETLKIGGAASNAFLLFDAPSDIYELGPDGVYFNWEPSAAALPVAAGSADLLKLDAGANTVVYDIIIVGSSA